MLAELYREQSLASFTNYVRELICVDGVRVFDSNVRMAFVKSRFICGGFFRSSDYYNIARIVIRPSRTEGCVLY